MSRLPWLLSRTIAALAIGLGLTASVTADEAAPAAPQKAVSFETDVRPILAAKCVRCHGPETHKSDLNLSTSHGIRQGSETGPILDENSPRESKLYEYVHQRMMPPEGEGELSDAEIGTITRWIEAGAPLGESRGTKPHRSSRSSTRSQSCCCDAPSAMAASGRRLGSTFAASPPC